LKYIIDSDILIYFLKNHPKVVNKFAEAEPDDIAVTIISYAELLFGAYNSLKIKENLSKIKSFLETMTLVNFDKPAADIFARLKSDLRKEGKIISDMDLIIASICIANQWTLITNNLKHFKRIRELKIENWSS
jgi:tRNA(fMet)-specific endonuclease VapC